MMKKSLLTLLVAVASQNVVADQVLGLFIGGYNWQQDFDGQVQDLDTTGAIGTNIDFKRDLGLDDDSRNVVYIALEHPVPVLPNVRIQHTPIEISGTNSQPTVIEFGGESFTSAVNSEADLTHTDLTLYYQLLDNVFSIDAGLTVRFIDGFVRIADSASSQAAEESFSAPIPLLYLAARLELPLTGAYAAARVNALGDGDNNLVDAEIVLGYALEAGFGAAVGYRSLDLQLDDIDDVRADLTVDGAFLEVSYHF